MTIEHDHDDGGARMSEHDYWADITAYNADGTYAYPPPPINADQVFAFWLHVPVPDAVLGDVRWRDQERHAQMEAQLNELHTRTRYECYGTSWLVVRERWLSQLSPNLLQKEVDALAQRRKYRRHPELLEQTRELQDLRLAIQRTNELLASVPPLRIPDEQIRMAARLGALARNCEGLQTSEIDAIRRFEVVFMGGRQSISEAWTTWRPDLIV